MKKYQVIFQDEYNNLFEVGFYDKLEDSIKDVNEYLEPYEEHIDELEEYASTFGYAFDKEIYTKQDFSVMIRGFIHE